VNRAAQTSASRGRDFADSTAKVPYLYIAGASFSGSTLLAFLLNAHPEMVSVSEVVGPPSARPRAELQRYSCSCGQRLVDCSFFQEMQRRILAQGSTFDLLNWRTDFKISRRRLIDIPLVRPLRRTWLEKLRDGVVPLVPGYRPVIREIAMRNLHFARAALSITGKKVFVDAQKDPIRIKFLSEIDELDLRVVHLVRDLRGGASSFIKHNPKNNPARAAYRWSLSNMTADQARRYVGGRPWMLLRYDEICEDYQAVVDRIAKFAGVSSAVVPETFYQTHHHIIGNTMRLRPDSTIRLDESWKSRLSEADLRTIARVAGRINHYFGFDWP
jgi:hypothetical protein